MACAWSVSEYFESLENNDKLEYQNKLCLSDGTQLPDPYSLCNGWKSDVRLLPDIGWPDLYNYFINTPSAFTQQSLKAYKSLEAYNFFICGHVQDVYYHEIGKNSKFCYLKSEVLPSQRQGQKQTLYKTWVAVDKKESWILTANCTCMAGLGSVCSHVAALLFKLQACSQLDLNKEACTSKLCAWKKSRRQATPAPLINISFKRPKNDDLVPNINDKENDLAPLSAVDPSRSCTDFFKEKLKELKTIAPNAAVFTSTTFLESNVDYDSSGTETADEDDKTCIPEPLSSFFEYQAINFTEAELESHCEKVYHEYKTIYSDNIYYHNLQNITKQQAQSNAWKIHRVGRITASNAKMAYKTDINNPSKTFINTIMNYNTMVDVPATKYGKKMELHAKRDFFEVFKKKHQAASIDEIGLSVHKDCIFMGASPDGIITCKCHGTSCLEIKCPYKYKEGLDGWSTDKNFPISSEGLAKKEHPYYYQMQLQMHVTDTKNCYFFIWSKPSLKNPMPNNYFLLQIEYDKKLCKSMQEKFEKLFVQIILPELITRRMDSNNEKKEQFYCICNRPSFPPMIACDGKDCVIEWYHYSCARIMKAPKHKWYCNDCKNK